MNLFRIMPEWYIQRILYEDSDGLFKHLIFEPQFFHLKIDSYDFLTISQKGFEI